MSETEHAEHEAWGKDRPYMWRAWLLGRNHSHSARPLSRTEFFDTLGLDVGDYQDGHSATALYHQYLDARQRARSY